MFLNQTKKWFVGAGVFICLYILSGCNHLYYHPDDKIYVNPDRPFWGGRPLTIKLKNEVVLDGLYIPKKNQAPCQNKILIHFHGNAQNLTAHFPLLEWVKNIGVDYYTFDYPCLTHLLLSQIQIT